MARSYTKRDTNYWNSLSETTHAALPQTETQNWKPETAGDPFYTSSHSLLAHTAKASLGGRMSNSDSTGQRVNAAAMVPTFDRFASIRAGLLPYKYSRDCVDVRDAIELCQKAFANVAVFRNAILLMAEFANTDIFLEGGTKKSRDFFEAWLRKIGIWKICNQFFLEYYRASNIFIYRVDGAFDASDYIKLTQVYAAEGGGENKIPVKYIFLNPYDITSRAATAFSKNQYEKILSRYDLIKLKDPQTDEDREIFESLPKEAKEIISKKAFQTDGIRIKLSPDMLITSFASKMDYEPFAIPFGYPVLEDINAKLELKKMDQAILRTVENAILLITMGAKPDEGGINQGNLAAMQNLFKNESVGRVLISDWTTKAEFIIPDLKKVLGPEKYEVLNKDISEGLQNVIVGEEKYGNTQTKVQIFLEKLRVARNSFLLDFLQPEIRRIAKDLGMRKFPTAKFKQTDAKDPTQMWRVITRMMELGLLSADQGLTAIRTGEFPDPDGEEFLSKQEEFTQSRKKGLYNPLNPVPVTVAPPPKIDPNNLIKTPSPTSGKPSPKKKSKVLTPAGRPKDSKASIQDVGDVVRDTENLLRFIEGSLTVRHGELSENQKQIAEDLMRNIVCAEEKDNWIITASACLEDNSRMLGLNPRAGVLDMAAEQDLSLYEAALLVLAQE